MSTVNEYQIYCITEGVWKHTWGQEPPTVCPTNTADTVNLSSVAIVSTVSETHTVIHQPTAGRYMVEMFPLSIPSGTPGATVNVDLAFDSEILLWLTAFNCTADLVGDKFDVVLNPDTIVGGLTATGNTSDTVLNVSSTVTGNVTVGMYLTLHNSPDVQDLGKVMNVDADAGTVTVSNALSTTFPPGSILTLTLYLARNVILDMAGPANLAEKGFQGKVVPAGTTMRMVYTNNDGAAKVLNWRLGFFYGADFSGL